MVRNDVRDTMKRPSKITREQHEYLNYDEIEEGKKYIDQKHGIIQIIEKHEVNGRKILFVKSPAADYEKPIYFKGLRLKK